MFFTMSDPLLLYYPQGNVTPLSYQLSVWRPGEEARAVLKEGCCVRLHFVGTSNYR